MTEEEIKENERLWREENGSTLKPKTDSAQDMRSVGVSPGGLAADAAGQGAEAPEDMAAAAEAGTEGGAEAAPAEPPAQ
jgi:hypothetical protein